MNSPASTIFEYQTRVEFEDVDLFGIVFYPRFLCYLERARSAAIKSRGTSFHNFIQSGFGIIITENHNLFFRPMSLDDPVFIYTRLKETGKYHLIIEQLITKEPLDTEEKQKAFSETLKKCMNQSTIKLVCINMETRKPTQLPQDMIDILK